MFLLPYERLLLRLFDSLFATSNGVYYDFHLRCAAQSWGVLLYENLHALNILTKGSLLDTLADRECRLVLALMVRESYKVCRCTFLLCVLFRRTFVIVCVRGDRSMSALTSAFCFIHAQILDVAAKGGVWKPDLLLINANLTPWVLEMILALPNALFFAAFWWLRLLPGAGVISPGQLDIVEGRKSMLDWHFPEIVQVNLSLFMFASSLLL